jgi:hypothetical protein
MRNRYIFSLARGTALGTLLTLPLLVPAQNADSKAINDLLKTSEEHAVLANNDAETLESYTRTKTFSSQSHAVRLNAMKEHANDLITDFNKLNLLRDTGSAWQQEAIDRVDPLLKEMSAHLTSTIDHFNENKRSVNMPPFRDYVKANREYMSRASELISAFVEYGETKAKAESLEKSLELPETAEIPKE